MKQASVFKHLLNEIKHNDCLELSSLDNMSIEWLLLLYLSDIVTFQDLSTKFGNDVLEKMSNESKKLNVSIKLPNLEIIYEWIAHVNHLDL